MVSLLHLRRASIVYPSGNFDRLQSVALASVGWRRDREAPKDAAVQRQRVGRRETAARRDCKEHPAGKGRSWRYVARMTTSDPVIQTDALSKRFGKRLAVDNATFEVPAGLCSTLAPDPI